MQILYNRVGLLRGNALWKSLVRIPLVLGAIVSLACTSGSKDTTRQPSREPIQSTSIASGSPIPQGSTPNSTNGPADQPIVLFIGTSLTAGYGLEADQAYPAIIEHLADSAGLPITAVNLGVSGETSAGALRRMDWVLNTPAHVIVIETGANDALRGFPVSSARSNIEAIIDKVQKTKPGVPVLLVQMEAPPNLGASYTRQFRAIYTEVSKEKGVALAPFLLDRVAGNPKLNLPDGIHPNPAGARIVAQNVWNALKPLVEPIVRTR